MTGPQPRLPLPDQLSPEVRSYALQLRADVEAARTITTAQLQSDRALPFQETLAYDPMEAEHLPLIQSSPLQLTAPELNVLAAHGFVLSARQRFPSFAYGYATIYMADLPVYISADSILDALHRSYDEILLTLELGSLRAELDALLQSLQTALAAKPASTVRNDLDTYLAVARGLLSGDTRTYAGGDPSTVMRLVAFGESASGPGSVTLFGGRRTVDFSQFKPRGHYEQDPQLSSYFRAMMWLGRVDFRLVETEGPQRVLRRPQVEAMLLLHSLFGREQLDRFTRIDDSVRAFVGESDNMTLGQVPELLDALGIHGPDGLAGLDDDQTVAAILGRGFGAQKILSDLVEGGIDGPAPMNAIFLLFGQRYVVDSHVFSNVVWDRTRATRMMPDPLDVAFAALGNDQAPSLLVEEFERYDYAGDLNAMRTLVDSHGDDFWSKNLYNDWLTALRALSPDRAALSDLGAAGLPGSSRTAAWGRRILNTQLASWAQLRHDTLLYAKQSYTSGAVCEFPDAAVDPYPQFYAAIERFAEHGHDLANITDGTTAATLGERMRAYFAELHTVATTLRGIAEAQRAHSPLDEAQLAFINDAVVIKSEPAGCTSVDTAEGWYSRLFFLRGKALEYDPTIADVHTQPTDAGGTPVGAVLHVATAEPRLMVVTHDSCGTPKAYVGLASSYFEQITKGYQRMTDSEWESQLRSEGAPPEVEWMNDLVVR